MDLISRHPFGAPELPLGSGLDFCQTEAPLTSSSGPPLSRDAGEIETPLRWVVLFWSICVLTNHKKHRRLRSTTTTQKKNTDASLSKEIKSISVKVPGKEEEDEEKDKEKDEEGEEDVYDDIYEEDEERDEEEASLQNGKRAFVRSKVRLAKRQRFPTPEGVYIGVWKLPGKRATYGSLTDKGKFRIMVWGKRPRSKQVRVEQVTLGPHLGSLNKAQIKSLC
jgi:hypothetical protein